MTKERPMLFRGDLVRAILEGRKTVTRRPVKGHPGDVNRWRRAHGRVDKWVAGYRPIGDKAGKMLECPFGGISDVLWVREAWAHRSPHCYDDRCGNHDHYRHRATDPYADSYKPWRPSIHMPREACRLRLRITDVGVERLQDITEHESVAEGVTPLDHVGRLGGDVFSFASSWDDIYAERRLSWADNPWVWRIAFEVE